MIETIYEAKLNFEKEYALSFHKIKTMKKHKKLLRN